MTEELISALLEKNAFESSTIITAAYTSTDVFGRTFEKVGQFRVRKIVKSSHRTLFELMMSHDSSSVMLAPASNIRAVDGMDICRYADIYDLLPDGTSKKVGRKRGRKPKTQLSA